MRSIGETKFTASSPITHRSAFLAAFQIAAGTILRTTMLDFDRQWLLRIGAEPPVTKREWWKLPSSTALFCSEFRAVPPENVTPTPLAPECSSCSAMLLSRCPQCRFFPNVALKSTPAGSEICGQLWRGARVATTTQKHCPLPCVFLSQSAYFTARHWGKNDIGGNAK
jgi:hypothetical protein